MTSINKDLELKLRTMRYLWHLGYFVRMNIDLVGYDYARSRVYTDIDVLGIKLDESLTEGFVACDCKSGATAKTAERLFWLSGVMNYFGAKEGLFVRDQVISARYIELSRRLNITPLSSSQLSYLERIYGIPQEFYGPFCKEQNAAIQAFSQLKKHNRLVHDYVLKGYWKDQPHQQITTLIASCQRIRTQKGLREHQRTFVLAYALSYLSLAILRQSRSIISVPDEQKEAIAREELLGGTMSIDERERLLEAFYGFMTTEIKERYKEKYPLSRRDFVDSLVPEYSKYFVDLVARICEDPVSSIQTPRLLDLFAFEEVVNGREVASSDVMTTTLSRISLKPTKDFLVFAERSNLVTDAFRELSRGFIDSLDNMSRQLTQKRQRSEGREV